MENKICYRVNLPDFRLLDIGRRTQAYFSQVVEKDPEARRRYETFEEEYLSWQAKREAAGMGLYENDAQWEPYVKTIALGPEEIGMKRKANLLGTSPLPAPGEVGAMP
ncbi:hypothetical protein LJC20_01900 [Eubacteriales bacterium OttesenSCG-928-M02]|nr:hypothetical protein [Eubacteriales bacterium OttesenSCG-928-M02]